MYEKLLSEDILATYKNKNALNVEKYKTESSDYQSLIQMNDKASKVLKKAFINKIELIQSTTVVHLHETLS